MSSKYIFSSKSVTEGHPDKVYDQISDTILDALLAGDNKSRVATEVVVNTGLVLVTGEITSKTQVNLVRDKIWEASAMRVSQVWQPSQEDLDTNSKVVPLYSSAIAQGRAIYSNIRKSLHFLLATNLSELAVMIVGTAAGFTEPLNTMQLLWLNLVTDVFPSLGLALEAPESNILDQSPRNPQGCFILGVEL